MNLVRALTPFLVGIGTSALSSSSSSSPSTNEDKSLSDSSDIRNVHESTILDSNDITDRKKQLSNEEFNNIIPSTVNATKIGNKLKFRPQPTKMQNLKEEKDEKKQTFERCDPSSAGTSSTTKEGIDYGQLRHRRNLPNDGCSSPGERCIRITNPAIGKVADSLTQHEDVAYADGLCIPFTYFDAEPPREEQQQQQQPVIDGDTDSTATTNTNTNPVGYYHGYVFKDNFYDIGDQDGDDEKKEQQLSSGNDETGSMNETPVGIQYYNSHFYKQDKHNNHGPDQRDNQARYHATGEDTYFTTAEHSQLQGYNLPQGRNLESATCFHKGVLGYFGSYIFDGCAYLDGYNVKVAGTSFVFDNNYIQYGSPTILGDGDFKVVFTESGTKVVDSYTSNVFGFYEYTTEVTTSFNDDSASISLCVNLGLGIESCIPPVELAPPRQLNLCSSLCPSRPKIEKDGYEFQELVRDCILSFSCPEDYDYGNTPIGCWNVSGVTNMYKAFYSDYYSTYSTRLFFNEPLRCWDVSGVTAMDNMFVNARYFNQPLENWDVSGVTNMQAMFFRAHYFNQPLEDWDVSGVKDMGFMFFNATNFNQPLQDWDVSRVRNMEFMFFRNYYFNQPLEGWDVSRVISMKAMFKYAEEFNQPLDKWDVSRVDDMLVMFINAVEFNQCLLTWAFKTPDKVDTTNMFQNTSCPNELWNPDPTRGPWCRDEGCTFGGRPIAPPTVAPTTLPPCEDWNGKFEVTVLNESIRLSCGQVNKKGLCKKNQISNICPVTCGTECLN